MTATASTGRASLSTWWPYLVLIVLCVLTGYIVSSSNIAVIGLFGAAIAAAFLLGAVEVVPWIVIIGVLGIGSPLIFHAPGLQKLVWVFAALGIFALFASLLQLITDRKRQAGDTPLFIVLFALFLLISLGSALWSQGSLVESGSGLKRYLQFIGLAFLLSFGSIGIRSIRGWAKLILIIALFQFPMGAYQQFYLMGLYGWTIDAVVGTFELTAGGAGANGTLAMYSIAATCGVLAAAREKLLPIWLVLPLVVICASPLALGEVKVAVFWLPIGLGIVYFDLIRSHPMHFLGGAFVVAILSAGLAVIVLSVQGEGMLDQTLSERLQTVLDYNVGELGYDGGSGLNRSTVFSYWWGEHGLREPLRLLIGHGVGSAYSTDEECATICLQHGGRALTLVTGSALLWEVGALGLIFLFLGFALAAMQGYRLARNSESRLIRVVCIWAAVVMALTLSSFILDYSLGQLPSQQVLSFLAAGVIAWAYRYDRSNRLDARFG